MLTIAEAQRQTELFLTGQMFEALQAVEYELPSFDAEPHEDADLLLRAARQRVEILLAVVLLEAERGRALASRRPDPDLGIRRPGVLRADQRVHAPVRPRHRA